jgi:ATP-dependent DNA helicase RecG
MTKKELQNLINQSEGHNLELKTSTNLKQEIGQAVSAFANTSGGVILVGVSPDGNIVGVDIGKKTVEDLANWIKQNTDPPMYPQILTHKVDDKDIIEIVIKESDEKPIFSQGHAYQRVGRTSPRISISRIRELAKQERKTLAWDEKICEEADLEDIDENKVRWFLKKAKAERNLDIDPDTSTREALERLEFTKNGRLTNAAVLLFGKSPQRFFLMAETRCGRFKGTEPVKPFIDMKVFGGSIIDQVDNAEDFVLRNISMAAWVEKGKIERTEKWEYPPDAIREAIVNAVCHRDYEISSNVQVRVFDDRIEVWGCGPLPAPLTVEALMGEHKSVLRNPLIGKCFFLIKFIEHWGTGTNDIIKDCLAMGLPEPIFKYVINDLVITFRKYPILEDLEKLGLNERQRKAIEFLKQYGKLTFSEYRKIYPDAAERTLRKDLEDLVKTELIKPTGEKKGRKYYLK